MEKFKTVRNCYSPQFCLRSPPFYSDYSPLRFFRLNVGGRFIISRKYVLKKCERLHLCFSLHLKFHFDGGFCVVESICAIPAKRLTIKLETPLWQVRTICATFLSIALMISIIPNHSLDPEQILFHCWADVLSLAFRVVDYGESE